VAVPREELPDEQPITRIVLDVQHARQGHPILDERQGLCFSDVKS
jgi:hypothetical protein